MQKIKITADEEIQALTPQTMAMRVTARSRDGVLHEVEIVNPLGHPNNPMQDADIEKKFHTLGDPIIGAGRCQESLEAWWWVSDATDLRPLIRLLDI